MTDYTPLVKSRLKDFNPDWLEVLQDSYQRTLKFDSPYLRPVSRLDFLSRCVFRFDIYDHEMSECFAEEAIEVCKILKLNREKVNTENKILDTIDNTYKYFTMINMPFFKGEIFWDEGDSILKAYWFDQERIKQLSEIWIKDIKFSVVPMHFCPENWIKFTDACIEFSELTDNADSP
jgi:hypothetical protein